jgi:hypothetical protein
LDLPGIRKNIIFSLFSILLPIFLSGTIYLFFRTSETVIYQLFQDLFHSSILVNIRSYLQVNSSFIPDWFIYSLPGGLWVFAFANFCYLLLNKETKAYYKSILFLLFGIVTSLELLQLYNVTDGSFDLMDILFYLAASLTSLSIGNFRIKKIKYQPIFKDEKKPVYALGLTVCIFCATIYLADVLT